MAEMEGSTSAYPDIHALHKEWDDTSCPICMDHPHNAVLLMCSSHEKGCKSYICDTSYRHSNCLDRFKKLKNNYRAGASQGSSPFVLENSDNERLGERDPQTLTSELFVGSPFVRRNLRQAREDYNIEENDNGISAELFEMLEETDNNQEPDTHMDDPEERIGHERPVDGSTSQRCLQCPLCRGTIMGWMIDKEARDYLDLKRRSCSRESCTFSGNYRELRKHARRIHPTTRPADVDPSRQRAWRRLEDQREYGDILSAIRSAMPGAIVMGDYVIDNNALSRDRESGSGEVGGPWWTAFFLFHMVGSPVRSLDGLRGGSSRAWRTNRRSLGGNRNLWGENLLGLQGTDDDENLDDNIPIPRRRRRFMRSRSNEHQ